MKVKPYDLTIYIYNRKRILIIMNSDFERNEILLYIWYYR